jgi:hypothetical protein
MHTCQLLALMLTVSYAHAAAPLPTQFVLNTWDTTTGLPEETISSLTQTPDGYLWLANANGLVRYDGTSFQTYQPRRDLGGGVRQEISRMGPGPDNSVWVYSKAYGLVHFQHGVFRHAPEYPKPCDVSQILEDRNGTLIVCRERVLRIVGERVDELTKDLSGPVHLGVRRVAVYCDDPRPGMTRSLQGFLEELLGRSPVSLSGKPKVDRGSGGINGTIQVPPAPTLANVRFVDPPGAVSWFQFPSASLVQFG